VSLIDNTILHRSWVIECYGFLFNKTKYIFSAETHRKLVKVSLINLKTNTYHNSRLYPEAFLKEDTYLKILELNLYDHNAAVKLAKKNNAEELLGHCFLNFYPGKLFQKLF